MQVDLDRDIVKKLKELKHKHKLKNYSEVVGRLLGEEGGEDEEVLPPDPEAKDPGHVNWLKKMEDESAGTRF